MEQRTNYLSLMLLDALEDENRSDIFNILDHNKDRIDPSYVPKGHGIGPLHVVCGMDNEQLASEIAERFLEMGANPNVKGEDNLTPLHIAAMYGRVKIVRLLLDYGASLEVYDAECKTPALYAIEECHFELLQIIRDHIFLKKFDRKKKLWNDDVRKHNSGDNIHFNKFIAKVSNLHSDNFPDQNTSENEKLTPNRVHYNYDITSPYYINITHRRHKPQPLFLLSTSQENQPTSVSMPFIDKQNENTSIEKSGETQQVNIFHLTQENLNELTMHNTFSKKSRKSIVETWLKKSHRQSIEKTHILEIKSQQQHSEPKDTDFDIGAGDSTCSSVIDKSNNDQFDQKNLYCLEININTGTHMEREKKSELENDCHEEETVQLDSTYQTVPEFKVRSPENKYGNQEVYDEANDTSHFIRSPRNGNCFLQVADEYIHTDDENCLVFYETKLHSNVGNIVASEREKHSNFENCDKTELNSTTTSQCTNITIPVDYETDTLRAELTIFGEPPGPITKTTKRVYIKRLIKYQRKTMLPQSPNKKPRQEFSVQLLRTLKSLNDFQRIHDYMIYETLSMEYFSNNQKKRQMREGHKKHTFTYMLLDPRISCNLPGESAFLDKFEIWQRFLPSIFYVGKGKTSRPYSHLYEAMKIHSRDSNKSTVKNQQLNVKSPPQKSSINKKLDRILDIWASGKGVICLHVFHNIVAEDGFTREAAIIDALTLQHLTNLKKGDYYGPAKTWSMKEKKYLGIALLYKAMLIYLAEGESQLSPGDLI